MNESIQSALDLLDAQMTDAEFRRSVGNTKLLSDCKKKGFPAAVRRGLIQFPEKVSKPRIYRQLEGEERDKAFQAVTKVNKLRNKGAKINDACEQVGIAYQKYYDWCKSLGVDHRRRKLNIMQSGHTQEEAKELVIRVNKHRSEGKTILQACLIEQIAIGTYHNWTYKFKIKYTKPEKTWALHPQHI